jgi:hypothetical protein
MSQQIPPPDLIKIDIEGEEYNALVGASDILVNHSPTILLATHGSEIHHRCCKLLLENRYRLKSLDDLPLERTSEVLAISDARNSGPPPDDLYRTLRGLDGGSPILIK